MDFGKLPGRRAFALGNRYLVYPHGMLDPWFKKTYSLKHLKKQLYWWAKQKGFYEVLMRYALPPRRSCTRSKDFFPYRVKEVVTGLGVKEPPPQTPEQTGKFYEQFPKLKGRKMLLYLGRFHPKKGVDNLIRAWSNREQKGEEVLVLAGPLEKGSDWINNLKDLAKEDSSIHWTGMLEGDLKWSALQFTDSMILPSHQENYGMVVAEACSVGLPVYLTDKVNLWREIIDAGAGAVEVDTLEGIQKMVKQNKWTVRDHTRLSLAAKNCYGAITHLADNGPFN